MKIRNAIAGVALVVASLSLALGSAVAGDEGEKGRSEKRLRAVEEQQRRLEEELRELRQQVEQRAGAPPKVEEIERRQGILTEEVRRLREALAVPETEELKSRYGLGPAASKVYGVGRGLSIGGYGEANFRKVARDGDGVPDEFDLLRFVLYVGYKFNDWIVFNSETEFEHATTGEGAEEKGEVSIEFATLDFFLHPRANVRGGLVLVPMGFINEIHEPPFFHGNVRPPVEQQILPSTWRANGIGLFGELLPGLEYRTYGITSLDAKEFRASGIRGARQSGSRERADDWSWVGRLDYTFLPGTLLGGSAYLGDQGQNRLFGNPVDLANPPRKAGVFTQIYELHAQVRHRGLEFRALGAWIGVSDAALLSSDPAINPRAADAAKRDQPVARGMLGYYGEIAYDILPWLLPETDQYLAPWFRYSRFDTQNSVPLGRERDNRFDRDFYEFGLTYKPHPQIVLKADYRIQDAKTGNLPDEIRLGGGFVF